MNNKSHTWKIVAFLAACIGCCAAPLLIGLLGGSIGLFSASFLAESKELIMLSGILLLTIIAILIVRRYRTKSKDTCYINCGCKLHTGK